MTRSTPNVTHISLSVDSYTCISMACPWIPPPESTHGFYCFSRQLETARISPQCCNLRLWRSTSYVYCMFIRAEMTSGAGSQRAGRVEDNPVHPPDALRYALAESASSCSAMSLTLFLVVLAQTYFERSLNLALPWLIWLWLE